MNQDKRRKWTAVEKMRIVMSGIQKDVDIAELCRRDLGKAETS
jgi:transposase-like protein